MFSIDGLKKRSANFTTLKSLFCNDAQQILLVCKVKGHVGGAFDTSIIIYSLSALQRCLAAHRPRAAADQWRGWVQEKSRVYSAMPG